MGSLLAGVVAVRFDDTAEALGLSGRSIGYAIQAGVFFCPALVLLQLLTAFYLAVWHWAGPVRWQFLLRAAALAALLLGLDFALVIKPFFDSWD